MATRSIINEKGKLVLWEQINNTRFEGCSCATGHAPCQYCTDTFECDRCGHIFYYDECIQTKFGNECRECIFQNYKDAFTNL